jgi:geranylgeranylglycerol-phosphate geranylgeranyltransferase
MFAAFCASAGGFLINDYFDVEKDRINHPDRVLPSGKLSRKNVLCAALASFGLALLFASLLNIISFLLVALNIALLLAYSRVLVFSGLIGNIIAAYLSSSLLLLAGLVAEHSKPILPYAAFIFFVMLGREIVFDIRDIKGDAAEGLRTLPIQIGVQPAFRVVWRILGLATLSVVIFWIAGLLEARLMLALIVTLVGLVYGVHVCQSSAADKGAYARFIVLSRVAFLLTIIVFWLGTAGVNRPT